MIVDEEEYIPEGHTNPTEFTIGQISFINENNDKLDCIVKVYCKEQVDIPHFHIIGINKPFECCIRIFENYYYSHNGQYIDVLSPLQCSQLYEWMKEKNSIVSFEMTFWQSIFSAWDIANFGYCKYPEEKKNYYMIPDYKNMREFKDDI